MPCKGKCICFMFIGVKNQQSKCCPSCMWHACLIWYMSHPNIIKLLWPAQYFGFREDKYITNSESCLSCTRHAYWPLSMPLPNIIKIFQTTKKLWSAPDFGLGIYSGEIIIKKNKERVVLLACDAYAWPDIFFPTKLLKKFQTVKK